jgi:hypothetical protein
MIWQFSQRSAPSACQGAALVEGVVRRGNIVQGVHAVDHRNHRSGRDLFGEFGELRGTWICAEGADAAGTEDGGRGDRSDRGAGQPHGYHPAALGESAAVACEVGADSVDNDVEQAGLLGRGLTVVEDAFGAQVGERGGVPGSGEGGDPAAECVRELDCGRADPAGRPTNEDSFARFHAGRAAERGQGGDPGNEQRRGLQR